MSDWLYTEHYLINSLRLLCYWAIGILMGMFIQKNNILERLKTRLTRRKVND